MKFSEFTFCTISYNQEEIILEHLESIRYQIDKFAKGITINFIYSDDFSSDQTFQVVNRWINLNKKLFSSYKLIKQNQNVGVLKNYLSVLSEVKTPHFKILAGDDLYGPFNIFKALKNNTIIFTPVMLLNKKGIDYLKKYPYRFIYNHSTKLFQKRLNKGSMIQAPGVFFNDIGIFDLKYTAFMNQFEYYEDFPSWFYFFVLNSINYKFLWKPYIIYRIDYQKNYHLVNNSIEIKVKKDFLMIKELINKTSLSKFKNDWLRIIKTPEIIFFTLLYYLIAPYYKNFFYRHLIKLKQTALFDKI